MSFASCVHIVFMFLLCLCCVPAFSLVWQVTHLQLFWPPCLANKQPQDRTKAVFCTCWGHGYCLFSGGGVSCWVSVKTTKRGHPQTKAHPHGGFSKQGPLKRVVAFAFAWTPLAEWQVNQPHPHRTKPRRTEGKLGGPHFNSSLQCGERRKCTPVSGV